jgi:hypothetical protein
MFAPSLHFRAGSQIHGRAALSEDQLRKATPSVFAEAAHASRSERYTYIPTIEVLRALKAEGFEVFSAKQARARAEGRSDYTKHLLRLRHASQISAAAVVGDSVAEILLLNSHDGSSSYQMSAGAFRFVCSNGLAVPDGICQTVRVSHQGKIVDKVTEGAFEILDGLTRVIDSRDAMRAVTLNDGEASAFARAALRLRFDVPQDEASPDLAAPVTEEQMLRPRRIEDRGMDLWSVLNRVQENALKGGVRGRNSAGQRTTTREVKGIDQDVKLNRAIWTLGEEMRRLKVAH